MNNFFLHQIRKVSDNFDKGIAVKNSIEDAKQSYHAYLGAYAYNHDANTDYVSVMITDMNGAVIMQETWIKPVDNNAE